MSLTASMFGDESISSQMYPFSRHNWPFASVRTACATLADDVSDDMADDVDTDVAANVAADAAGDAKLTWQMMSFFQIVTDYN